MADRFKTAKGRQEDAQAAKTHKDSLQRKLDKCHGQTSHLMTRNLELEQLATRLALAIENHQLNTSKATPQDRVLWEVLDTLVNLQ